jgi:prevent-host-death family protein
MGIHVNIGEAKNRLSELIAASLRGEEVILSKAGKPVARILALDEAVADAKESERAKRSAMMQAYIGSGKGMFPKNAADIFTKPEYTDEEIDDFSPDLGL